MKVSAHAASTGILSLIILILTNWQNAGLFFVGGVLIDIDHYFKFAWRAENISLINAYRISCEFSEKIKKDPKRYLSLCYLHTIEFLILVFAASLLWGNYFLLLGLCFHLLLDIIAMFVYHSVGTREFSVVDFHIRKKKLEKDKIII